MAEDVKITILSENTSEKENLAAEYGLSMWIEADGTDILFDTGMSGAFAKNAEVLGIDLSKAVHLCLSHGHFDHTGGVIVTDSNLPDLSWQAVIDEGRWKAFIMKKSSDYSESSPPPQPGPAA